VYQSAGTEDHLCTQASQRLPRILNFLWLKQLQNLTPRNAQAVAGVWSEIAARYSQRRNIRRWPYMLCVCVCVRAYVLTTYVLDQSSNKTERSCR
jgi:type VI protein secretion system component VasF